MPSHDRQRRDHGAWFRGDELSRLLEAVRPDRVVEGWATVELDRGEREFAAALTATGLVDPGVEAAPDDEALGASCRLLRDASGRVTVLLEPNTEGLLAAALARHGEGSVVRYLVADVDASARVRAAGFRSATEHAGPLGPQRLVLGGPRWGPFLVLVRAVAT